MSHHHKHKHHKNKGKGAKSPLPESLPNNEEPKQKVEPVLELSPSEIESIRSNLNKLAVPILLGTDGDTMKWVHHTGKSLENGIFYCGTMPGYGTCWKLECMLDCHPELYYKAMTDTFDVDWIPFLGASEVLKRADDYCVLHQKISGATAVSDRDFVIIQFCGITHTKESPTSPEVPIYYSMCQSVPDDKNYYNPTVWPSCVRGEYLPQGWSWTPVVEEDGRVRSRSTLIYNLDLKGLLPKLIVNLAATTFLGRHIKAAQQHALELAAKAAEAGNNIATTNSSIIQTNPPK